MARGWVKTYDHLLWGRINSGWSFHPLWKIWKSVGMIILNIWENKSHVPVTTNLSVWSIYQLNMVIFKIGMLVYQRVFNFDQTHPSPIFSFVSHLFFRNFQWDAWKQFPFGFVWKKCTPKSTGYWIQITFWHGLNIDTQLAISIMEIELTIDNCPSLEVHTIFKYTHFLTSS